MQNQVFASVLASARRAWKMLMFFDRIFAWFFGNWLLDTFGTIAKQKGCNANLADMKKTNIATKQKVQAKFDKIAKTLKHLKLSFRFPMFEQHKQNDTELTTQYCVSPSSIDCVLMQRNCSLSQLQFNTCR